MLLSALMPMAVLFCGSLWLELSHGVRESAQTMASSIDQHLASELEFFHLVASNEALADSIELAFYEDADKAFRTALKVNEHLVGLMLLDKTGTVLHSSQGEGGPVNLRMETAARQALLGKGKQHTWVGRFDSKNGWVPFFAPVRSKSGEVVGLLAGFWAIKALREQIGSGKGNFITDENNQHLIGSHSTGFTLHHTVAMPLSGWELAHDLPLTEAAGMVRDQLLALLGLVLLTVGGVVWVAMRFAKHLVRPIEETTATMKKISQGDLSASLRYRGEDQIGMMVGAFNTTLESLRQLVSSLREASGKLIGNAESLRANTAETSDGMSQIATQVEGLTFKAVWMEEIVSSTRSQGEKTIQALGRINEQIGESAETVSHNRLLSSEGVQAMEAMTRQMDSIVGENDQALDNILSLKDATEKVHGAAGLISHIAEQVNLLALNAAIEAERAGEHGRGFAVVSKEVRELAGVSSKAAREITQLIRQSQILVESVVKEMHSHQSTVREGASIVRDASGRFETIRASMDVSSASFEEIARASEEIQRFSTSLGELMSHMVKAVGETVQGTETIAGSVQEITAATHEVSDSAVDLSQMAQQLSLLVSFFKDGA